MPNGNVMAPGGMPGGMPPGIPMGGGGPSQGGPPNALAKQGQSPGGFSAEQHVEQNWEQAEAQHKQLKASMKRMKVARTMLDSLKKMGDQVQVEDVITGAGTMVGAGFSPTALAQMLSQMPTTGGEALQAWVEQQDQRAQQMDQQLQQKYKASAIHRGITAMASLHVHSIKQQHLKEQGAMGPGSPQTGNALSPQQQPDEEADQAPVSANAETGD
jgi:hypothetical protein